MQLHSSNIVFIDDSGNETVLLESSVYGNSRRRKIVIQDEDTAQEVVSSFLERQDYSVQSIQFQEPYIKAFTDEGVKLFYLSPI